MKCLCPQCTENPAPSYTDSWRQECEARYVAALSTDKERSLYLADVALSRGATAASTLRKQVWACMSQSRKKPAAVED